MPSSPVDHRRIIAELTTEQRNLLLGKSNAAGLRRLVVHLGAIGLMIFLILSVGAWAPVFMLIQGILLVFLFTTLHETVHRTPFRSRQLNDWVGRLCGLVIFLGPAWFRYFHLEHHRYTNEPGRDPEIASPRPSTRRQHLLHLSGIPETVDRWRTLVRNATQANTDSYVPSAGKALVKREARLQLAIYVVVIAGSALAGSTLLLQVWLVPVFLGAPFLRAYLLAEHAGCPDDPSMFRNTRTVLTNPAVRLVAWNMPYHAEHHAFPAVPFHKLARFHRHTRDHLEAVEPGYVRFNRNYLNMFK